MTTTTRSFISKKRAMHYFSVGQKAHRFMQLKTHKPGKATLGKELFRFGYSERFLYSLAKLPIAFTRDEYLRWLHTVDAGQLVLVAGLKREVNRQRMLKRLGSRHVPFRVAEELVREARRREKARRQKD
ncbi:MAG TPA: hypothetical protein VMP01_27165 [Pirellulaceae bacterium]|nr:hypothetical protein [Pirellulaceae bacterium]